MAISDEQILQATADVIAERGYAAATMKQIAARADINEVTLFRRFGSKMKLMRSMVEYETIRIGNMDLAYTGDLEADLLKIVLTYRELVQRRGHVMRMLLLEVPRQPELLEVVRVPQATTGHIAAIFARYQQEGRLKSESPMLALMTLIGPIMITGMIGPVEFDLSQQMIEPTDLVKNYLQGRAINP